MDFFFDWVLPIWIVFGFFIVGAAITFFVVAVGEYKKEKAEVRRYDNSKRVARLAHNVLIKFLWLLAAIVWPIAIIPCALYFPVKWIIASFRFFKQVFNDRKGV